MSLRLYNTLTRSKDEFVPFDRHNVRLYVCGPTVYDRAHIGNARPVIVFDVLFRLLRHLFGADHVTYVRNITDVEDKINARAAEENVSIRTLTERTAQGFRDDVAALGSLPPTVEPRATDHIDEMVLLIGRLMASGNAYVASGHVLFDVPSMPSYGRLSRRTADEMMAGARIEVAPYKKNESDFVLWKPAAPEEPGWDSPWGRGRPGWHIECSAMSWKYLGESFDIHGGGIDLIFPHHENEIAQTCCAFGHDVMAQIWMHNGFLQVEGEKMSKSLGNFITIHDLVATDSFGGRAWPGDVLRLAMLRTHYRQPIDWTLRALEEAERTLDRWYAALADAPDLPASDPDPAVLDALGDDLNTPAALGELHRGLVAPTTAGLGAAHLLGLLQASPAAWFAAREAKAAIGGPEVERLIAARLSARSSRDWRESDRIRDELAARSILLTDHKDGTTTWTVARKGAA